MTYFPRYNLMGDVTALVDTQGNVVVKYAYDAWGKVLSVTDGSGNAITDEYHVGNQNPFRYRGYYYDTETGFYYLQSRYYDPEVGRFLNADGVLGANGDLAAYNLFTYCGNSPILNVDPTGDSFFLISLLFIPNRYTRFIYNWNLGTRIMETNDYINGQKIGTPSKLKMGWGSGGLNGCSWIAAYNASKMLGEPIHPAYIILRFEQIGTVFFGLFGVSTNTVTTFFRQEGYTVTKTTDVNKYDEVAKKHKANILCYYYLWGAHYVAVEWNGKTFNAYNMYSNRTEIYDFKSLKDLLKEGDAFYSVLLSIK